MATITTYNRRAQAYEVKPGPTAEKCYSEEREEEVSVPTYQLYLLGRVRGLGAFVCLFVSRPEEMDAISAAILACLLCRVLRVIFHVGN